MDIRGPDHRLLAVRCDCCGREVTAAPAEVLDLSGWLGLCLDCVRDPTWHVDLCPGCRDGKVEAVVREIAEDFHG